MTVLIVLLIIAGYFAMGVVGGIACLRDFVRRLDKPNYGLAIAVLLSGPFGALVAMLVGAYKWQINPTDNRIKRSLRAYIDRTAQPK